MRNRSAEPPKSCSKTAGGGCAQDQRALPQRLGYRASHFVGRRHVAGADFDEQSRRDRRLGVVEDRLLRDDAVRDDQELTRLGAKLRRPPRDLLHLALVVADGDPVADAKRLFDLNGQPREQIAERVLQRKANHDCADRRGRQQLLLHQDSRHDREQPDEGDVLDDGREAIRRPVLAPGIGDQRDHEIDEREDEDQPRQRGENLDVADGLRDRDLEGDEGQQQPDRKSAAWSERSGSGSRRAARA